MFQCYTERKKRSEIFRNFWLEFLFSIVRAQHYYIFLLTSIWAYALVFFLFFSPFLLSLHYSFPLHLATQGLHHLSVFFTVQKKLHDFENTAMDLVSSH